MPNHVTHNFTVEGTEEDIKKFIDECFDKEGEFDFNRLIPMPDILENTICGSTPEMQTEEYKEKTDEAIKTTGYSNWYDWRLEHWGTKWNAYHTQIDHQGDFLELIFDTAWSCPEPIFKALSEKFPLLSFEGYAMDEGYCFGSSITIDSDGHSIEYFDIHVGFLKAFGYRFD